MVQWLELCLLIQGVWVQSLVGELRFPWAKIASWSKNQNVKQKQYCNKFNKDFKSGSGLVPKSCPTLATPWTIARQAPLSMVFSWNALPFPSPGIFPTQGSNPSLASQADSLPTEPQGKARGPYFLKKNLKKKEYSDSGICLRGPCRAWSRSGRLQPSSILCSSTSSPYLPQDSGVSVLWPPSALPDPSRLLVCHHPPPHPNTSVLCPFQDSSGQWSCGCRRWYPGVEMISSNRKWNSRLCTWFILLFSPQPHWWVI